jgi:acyl-CoA thioester hydrolase
MSLRILNPSINPVITKHHIRPSDLDSLGHVNNAVVLELFELGRMMWSNENAIELNSTVIPVVTKISLEYNQEVFVQPVEILTELVKEGFYELKFSQEISTNICGEKIVCQRGSVHVTLINKTIRRPVRLSAAFK